MKARELIDSTIDDVMGRIAADAHVETDTHPSTEDEGLFISTITIGDSFLQVDHDKNWRYVSILNMEVSPTQRNRGIGPKLLDSLFKQCPRGSTITPGTMVMEPFEMNSNAIRWMKTLGQKYGIKVGEAYVPHQDHKKSLHFYNGQQYNPQDQESYNKAHS